MEINKIYKLNQTTSKSKAKIRLQLLNLIPIFFTFVTMAIPSVHAGDEMCSPLDTLSSSIHKVSSKLQFLLNPLKQLFFLDGERIERKLSFEKLTPIDDSSEILFSSK